MGLAALTSRCRRAPGLIAVALLGGVFWSLGVRAIDAPAGAVAARIEARSDTTLAVALVNGDRMTIHLSRVLDNAPIRDAVLTVLLRGVVHPTVAEADGSYSLESVDLRLPGTAAVEFHLVQGTLHEDLKGALQVSAGADDKPVEQNSARQLGWWVLNFAVCIGFLMLWSRRRKNATED
jgi:hypothetical protein